MDAHTTIARTIPFGYDPEDENDPYVLQPVKLELDLLEKARDIHQQYSYRQVANWLTKNSGREISHVGLMKRLKNERQRKNKVTSLRKWAEYAEKSDQQSRRNSKKVVQEQKTEATS